MPPDTFIAHRPKQCLRQVLTQLIWSMLFGPQRESLVQHHSSKHMSSSETVNNAVNSAVLDKSCLMTVDQLPGLRGGEGTVDWDTVGSNRSMYNLLSNSNKITNKTQRRDQLPDRKTFKTSQKRQHATRHAHSTSAQAMLAPSSHTIKSKYVCLSRC